MADAQVTYYALLGGGRTRENPSGMVRRTRIGSARPVDEAFHRDLTWQPTEYLKLYWLGHDDIEHIEITEEEASTIIARWKAKWPIEDALDPDRLG